ncbi:MAG: polysaccharide biosynthesis/export family protein [Gemmataceae bacterium]
MRSYRWLAWLGAWLLAGCAVEQPNFDRALMSEPGAHERNRDIPAFYVVQCPDVLELRVGQHQELDGKYPVGPDGRIDLGRYGQLRVENQNLPEIRRLVAEVAGVDQPRVAIRVADYRSQFVYLYGQVSGLQRAVDYRGQETVLDMLQRVGGITPDGASNDVYVVRPHIEEGKPPEVFKIDLRAIVNQDDQRTNIRLQPYDEIHIGATRKSCLEKCVPPCFQPAFDLCCGVLRHFSTRRHDKLHDRGRLFKAKEPEAGKTLPVVPSKLP